MRYWIKSNSGLTLVTLVASKLVKIELNSGTWHSLDIYRKAKFHLMNRPAYFETIKVY